MSKIEEAFALFRKTAVDRLYGVPTERSVLRDGLALALAAHVEACGKHKGGNAKHRPHCGDGWLCDVGRGIEGLL